MSVRGLKETGESMRKRTRWTLSLVVVLLGLTAFAAAWVNAAPPRPATLYGTAKVNGQNPPAWALVEAQIGGVTYAQTAIQLVGGDMVYSLDVPGDSDLPGKQGGTAGETVSFLLGGLSCAQSTTWVEGSYRRLDLSATGSLPTPTPTNTVPPTNTPTRTPTVTETPRVTPTPAVIDLGPSNTTVRDTYVSSWAPTTAHGVGALKYRLKTKSGAFNSLLYFDTSSIPINASVQRATLNLYADEHEHHMHLMPNIRAHKVLTDWSDQEATWRDRLAGLSWSREGCNGPADREVSESGIVMIEGVRRWYEWEITGLVQDWVWSPSGNKGVFLTSDSTREVRFHSADLTGGHQPFLHVEYDVGVGPGPTPTNTLPGPSRTPSAEPPRVVEIRDASQDVFIDTVYPNNNFENQGLRIQSPGNKRCLLDFDVSQVPAGAQIISATLRLTTSTINYGQMETPMNVGAYLVNQDWIANQATWYSAFDGRQWSTAGCEGIPGDRSANPVASTSILEVSTGTKPYERVTYDWNVTQIVQAWVDSPADQAGLMLMSTDGMYREIGFWDSGFQGSAGQDLHPVLFVHWVPGEPTPAPTPTQTLTPTTGRVEGTVFLDRNLNGNRDAGEVGVLGATVQLLNGSQIVGEAGTIGSGAYSFAAVSPGSYTLVVVPPAGHMISTQNPKPVSISAGQTVEGDFGLYRGLCLPLVHN